MKFQECDYFATWLTMQGASSILESQVPVTDNIIDRLKSGDLICVLYFGEPELAMKALKELKKRFEEAMRLEAEWALGGSDEHTWN